MDLAMLRLRLTVLSAAAVLLAMAGCSKTAKVEGTVTYKGAPVTGATVTLLNDAGSVVAVGTTDTSGKFTLLTPQNKEDIPAGDYKATVTKSSTVIEGGSTLTEDGKGMSPDAMKMMKGNMGKGPMKGPGKAKSALPEKFATRDSTTLTVKVPPSGPVTLNLDN
jgi:hypothetical protein